MANLNHPKEDTTEIKEVSASQEDDALILWMLSLTPAQRLEVAQGFVDSVRALRNAKMSPLLPMGTPDDLRFEALITPALFSQPPPLPSGRRGSG